MSLKQWAAVRTQLALTSEPPHVCWKPDLEGARKLTIQGQEPGSVSTPPTACEGLLWEGARGLRPQMPLETESTVRVPGRSGGVGSRLPVGAMWLAVTSLLHQTLPGLDPPGGPSGGGQEIFYKRQGLLRGGPNTLDPAPGGSCACPPTQHLRGFKTHGCSQKPLMTSLPDFISDVMPLLPPYLTNDIKPLVASFLVSWLYL